ncbi:Prefoldin [Conidiobolus coronatus NRRL 28638]|uniref:Prefoldin n=1 Tax=Conidiobolus coronatus (strain ATCC 28846 / CBS 209.66 / NRRL 28638) TaxID=796925 RepID=A0A137P3S5_CONC2|nr:Prefoldin [Conidiobolus coronatus NRRL 28638]|eukprot:KXN69663.1 Prefoldin [Conidiobolus coronatus NRRL 28638]
MEKSFIETQLKPDLNKINSQLLNLNFHLEEFNKLKLQIQTMIDQNIKKFNTKIDMGCGVFYEAEIPDTTHINILIGCGVHVEFTLEEGLQHVNNRINTLNSKIDTLNKKSANIRANVGMMSEAIQELQRLEGQ